MAVRPLLALSLILFAFLSGCSDGGPSGKLVTVAAPIAVDGTSSNMYVAAERPLNSTTMGAADQCTPSAVPPGTPLDEGRCTNPSSTFDIHFMFLPEPDGNGYGIFLVGGAIGERLLAPLGDLGNGMMGMNITEETDLSGQFERLELRMGQFPLAAAPSAAGSQAFVVDANATKVAVTGSYKGKTLDIDVSGLPAKGPFVGRLYTLDATGNATVGESFPVISGSQSFKSERNIGDYAEFHIHVGPSKINLYKATL